MSSETCCAHAIGRTRCCRTCRSGLLHGGEWTQPTQAGATQISNPYTGCPIPCTTALRHFATRRCCGPTGIGRGTNRQGRSGLSQTDGRTMPTTGTNEMLQGMVFGRPLRLLVRLGSETGYILPSKTASISSTSGSPGANSSAMLRYLLARRSLSNAMYAIPMYS